MLERILVPLDGSSLAECVLDHVRILAKAFGSHVTLLRTLEYGNQHPGAVVNCVDWQLQKAEAAAYMKRITEQLSRQGITVNNVLLEGAAAQQIIDYTHEHEIDLIALSSHGSSGLSRWNMNSVVHKVITKAHTSILIVRAYATSDPEDDIFRYKRVLVPLDGSTRAECVLPVASALVDKEQGTLILTHIVAHPEVFHRQPLTTDEHKRIEQWIDSNVEKAKHYLSDLQARLSVHSQLHLAGSDDVIEALHDLADQESVDLVVFSAHGTSGKQRWPYGSLVNNFIAHSTHPLLIVQDMERHEIKRSAAELIAEADDQEHRVSTYRHS